MRSVRQPGFWRADGLMCAWAMLIVLCVFAGLAADRPLNSAAYNVIEPTLPKARPATSITVLAADDASLAALGPWPWSPAVHAQLIDQLTQAGSGTVVYTIPLAPSSNAAAEQSVRQLQDLLSATAPELLAPEIRETTTQLENALRAQEQLAASLRRAGNVLLAATPGAVTHSGVSATAPPDFILRHGLQQSQLAPPLVQFGVHPSAVLGQAANAVGYLPLMSLGQQGLYETPLLLRHGDTTVPSLALLANAKRMHIGSDAITSQIQGIKAVVRAGALDIPTTLQSSITPRFYAANQDSKAFATVSFADVLTGKVPAGLLKDKTILVGATAPSLVTAVHQLPGQMLAPVEVLGHVISNLQQGDAVVTPSWSRYAVWFAVLTALVYGAFLLPRMGSMVGTAVTLGLGVSLFGLQWGLLRANGLWLPMATPLALLVAGVLTLLLLRATQTHGQQASESTETDRMMGLALHGQGQLDMAFERLRRVPASADLLENLYRLARDFEQAEKPSKARAVYKHILQADANYRDCRARYKVLKSGKIGTSKEAAPEPFQASSSDTQFMDSMAMSMDLGRYRLGREIGHGSMGVVYMGHDPETQREIAIKTLALGQEFEGDSLVEARNRFFREAETAGRLQHPWIVRIFDAGQAYDLAYIAMEFVPGHDLSRHSSSSDLLPVKQVLSIAARVAEALDYAHAQSVVHRDIKPSNIMFDAASDSVKVMDFGIARITDASKTRTGLVMGTPGFMSPEQLAGKKVDGRSDIYSLGVTLFQLLTGNLPFIGASISALMVKIANEPAPDIRILRPELSPELAQLVAFTLQKNPENRPSSGKELALALRKAMGVSDSPDLSHERPSVVYDANREATGHHMADDRDTADAKTAPQGLAPQNGTSIP